MLKAADVLGAGALKRMNSLTLACSPFESDIRTIKGFEFLATKEKVSFSFIKFYVSSFLNVSPPLSEVLQT